MNDRNKYRVYDKDMKCYLRPIEKSVVCEDGTEYTFFAFFDAKKPGVVRSLHYCMNENWFIVEQCTGIAYCKNLIFEGDRFFVVENKKSYFATIKFVYGGFYIVPDGADDEMLIPIDCINDNNMIDFEYTGNIHEVKNVA